MLLAHNNTALPSSHQDQPPSSHSINTKAAYGIPQHQMPSSFQKRGSDKQDQPISGYFDIPRRVSSLNKPSPHPLSIEYKEESDNDSQLHHDHYSQQKHHPNLIDKPFTLKLSNGKAPVNSSPLNKTLTLPQSKPLVDRPGMIRFHSTPTLPCLSPTRQQFRLPNVSPRIIKETLDASLRVDETGKTINQYLIKEEVGRGSFGTVWLVIDTQTNEKYAMKEYSKAALRRHKQSEQLRERRTARRRGPIRSGPNSAPELPVSKDDDPSNPINLIRREIAIMKKLDHPNIVTLVEVLDDPHGDSLYMILEWCGKGAIMPVSWDDDEDDEDSEDSSSFNPSLSGSRYTEEQCRLYFRDMILGIEYLHSQGVIHRDIKADNLLLDEDDVVKIADFGVSEILDPANDIITKNAGSPAYMAPELAALSSHTALKEHAATKGINVSSLSGKSTDIWSMGVTLYVLLFGKLPFRSNNMVDLFDKIVNDDINLPENTDPSLVDLFNKILAKAPQDRIKMDELREHPWVTLNHEDNLLSREENTADTITPVTEEDLYYAIEFVQGFMEPNQALEKLRRLHGFRGYSNNNSTPLSPPVMPAEIRRTPSPLDETISLYKLTRALEEIVTKSGGYTY